MYRILTYQLFFFATPYIFFCRLASQLIIMTQFLLHIKIAHILKELLLPSATDSIFCAPPSLSTVFVFVRQGVKFYRLWDFFMFFLILHPPVISLAFIFFATLLETRLLHIITVGMVII